jgi:O-antigen biosynthesis protein WbqP
MIKRISDVVLSMALIVLSFVPMLLLSVVIKLTSPGPVLHCSKRVGKESKVFVMLKFRSMYVDTPQVATHLLNDPHLALTSIGKFLRTTSLDELPQLWNILKGDMSFVGPRPALFNQHDLIEERRLRGIDILLPGLTGWAQVNGRDEISLRDKIRFDEEYKNKQSFKFDTWIMWLTILKVIGRADVSH